jgi:hypothetical protein
MVLVCAHRPTTQTVAIPIEARMKVEHSQSAARDLGLSIRTKFIASPLHRFVSPFVAAADHIQRGFRSTPKRSRRHAQLQAPDDAGRLELTTIFRSACNAGTDAVDLAAACRSRDPQAAESLPAAPGNDARNAGSHDASSISATPRVEVIESFFNQPVEPPRGVVFSNLAIPCGCIKLGIPSAKRRHLIRRQLLDRRFDFFDGTHGRQYTHFGH